MDDENTALWPLIGIKNPGLCGSTIFGAPND